MTWALDFGNVGTTVVFRVGPFDAEVLETIFMPKFTKEDVVALDRRQVYLSLMIDGVGSAPFSAVTIPPIESPPVSYREQVVASSRAQFTALRAGVENVIIEELNASAASEVPQDARMKKKPIRAIPKVIAPQTASQYKEILKPTPSVVPAPVNQLVPSPTVPIQSHPPTPIPPRPPIVVTKSAEDLKTILRNMTAKTGIEREKKQEQHQQSLKGALSEVLTREQPTQHAATQSPREKQPFEVSEDKLRDVLKGDI